MSQNELKEPSKAYSNKQRHTSLTKDTFPSFVNKNDTFHSSSQFYHPTPAPETVTVHTVPKKTNDACCWGCAAALCLCFGLEECCT